MIFDQDFFVKHQKLILWFANTLIGRYVLRIHGDRSEVGNNRIIRILPNVIEWKLDNDNLIHAEFRSHNKFAKRLYFAFLPIWKLFHWWDMNIANAYSPDLNLGFDTTDFIPDTGSGSTTVDGGVRRIADAPDFTETFSSLRNGAGNQSDTTSGVDLCGITTSVSDASNFFNTLNRSICTFNTAIITSLKNIHAAQLMLYGNATNTKNDLGSPTLNVTGSFPAANNNLVDADYQRVYRNVFAEMTFADYQKVGYNTLPFNQIGMDYVNKTGITALALQIDWDVVGTFGGVWAVGPKVSGFEWMGADTTGSSRDPILRITYSVVSIQNGGIVGISRNGAVALGQVTVGTGPSIFEQGIVVGTSAYPKITDRVFPGSLDDSKFRVKISGLLENTSYYARAYFKNSDGPGYATSNMQFTTLTRDIKKTFFYRIYSKTGVYLTTWGSDVISVPEFSSQINSGISELKITLARKYDELAESTELALRNRVDCYAVDKESPDGEKIYSGYISGYTPSLNQAQEWVDISVFTYMAEFNRIILKDSSENTTVSYTNSDVGAIMRDVIDKYRAAGGTINYSGNSIKSTYTSASYTFKAATIREAIDKIVEMAPAGWYWRVDPNNLIYFQNRNVFADHQFQVGRDVIGLQTFRRVEGLVNGVFFTGAGSPPLYRKYQNTDSQETYGRYDHVMLDSRVDVVNTASSLSNALINNQKDPEIRSIFIIADSNGSPNRGYDIELIKAGQTLQVRRLNEGVGEETLWDVAFWDVDVWDQTIVGASIDVLQILAVRYSPDQIEIEASSRIPLIAERVEEVSRNLAEKQTASIPTIPS